MNAINKISDSERYARCIHTSKRVRWDVDEDVIRGAPLRHRPQVPSGWAFPGRLIQDLVDR
jgi:hypothetical protein